MGCTAPVMVLFMESGSAFKDKTDVIRQLKELPGSMKRLLLSCCSARDALRPFPLCLQLQPRESQLEIMFSKLIVDARQHEHHQGRRDLILHGVPRMPRSLRNQGRSWVQPLIPRPSKLGRDMHNASR